MLNKFKTFSLAVCISGLSACATDTREIYIPPQETYRYDDDNKLYPESYEGDTFVPSSSERPEVIAPEPIDVGPSRHPVSHKDLDKEWVSHQNAQSYTIELATGEKPADVAKTLYQAPKTDRTAQIKVQQQGRAYYKGVYGSFPTQEAAQQAMSTLPQDIKQNAQIQTWGSIQNGAVND